MEKQKVQTDEARKSTSLPGSVNKPTDMDPSDRRSEPAGARPKKFTEKGLMFTLEQKDKQINSIYRQLKRKMLVINEMMTVDEDSSVVQHSYSEWLSMYEEYLDTRGTYRHLLGPGEDPHTEKDTKLLSFKSTVEKWTLPAHRPTALTRDVEPTDSVSQAGSKQKGLSAAGSRVSATSSLASSRVREEQHKAEIQAKISSLQKKRELELAKLNLKLEEEKFTLDTALAICQAKTQVLDDQLSQKSSVLSKTPKLRPNAPSFVPNKANMQTSKTKGPVLTEHMHDVHSEYNRNRTVTESNVNYSQSPNTQRQEPRQVNTAYRADPPSGYAYTERCHEQLPDNDIATVIRQLKKPAPELNKFSGDPLEYRRFLRQFSSKILANTDSYEEMLNYLEQYTSGEAHEIVTGYGYLEAQSGYEAAMTELEQRYGNDEALANAFVKRALDWPIVKTENTKALDDYGIFLAECSNAVQTIEAVKVLEYPDNMKKMVGKLPYFYHDKWRNIVQQHRDKGEQIKFTHLVTFVKREAQKSSDPTYGRDALYTAPKSTPAKGKQQRYQQKGAFAVVTETSSTTEDKSKPLASNTDSKNANQFANKTAFTHPCMHCNKSDHAMEKCDILQALPYDDKMNILKEKRLCFGCLKYGHRSKDCRSKSTCTQCKGRHPTVCHVDNFRRIHPKENSENPKLTSASVNIDNKTDCSTRAGDTECTMAIIPVTVKMANGSKAVQTYAFMDPGSSATFCTESLLRRVGGSGKLRKITLGTMGVPHSMQTFEVNGLQVGDINMDNLLTLPNIYTKDKLPVSVSHVPTAEDVKNWPHMKDVHLPKIDADVELLIGNNVPDAYSPLDTRTGPESGSPHATKSRLGWIAWNVIRPTTDNKQGHVLTVNRAHITAIEEIQTLNEMDTKLRQSINLDFPEHVIDDRKENSREDERFLEKVSHSMTLRDGHYIIDLPFRNDDVHFPDNQQQARQRLKGLKSKMTSNPKFKEDYKAFMSDILQKGYAEPVPPTEINRDDGKVWFIPHHGVYHPRKPDKIRVVFDCTAHHQGTSLNNELLQGPDLTNSLLAVLLRFRQEEVGLMADIESMFYQVHVPQKDRDCLRFLWWPNGDTEQEPAMYRMTVHLFGAVSSPSCANAALLQTSRDNKDRFDEEVTKVIEKNFYVDDCVVSVQSEEKASDLIQNVTELCQLGGFRLTKWSSNNRNVIGNVDTEELAKDFKTLDLGHDKLPSERALGVQWVTEQDDIGFDVKLQYRPETKRGILSVVSGIYDPLGFASPFLLTARVVLQELCRIKVGWDEEIPPNLLSKWRQWVTDLPLLDNLRLPRCYKPSGFGEITSCQLHAFSDASDSGYGVAIYLRLTNQQQRTNCTLVLGKSRVNPLKKTTIPRLELTAATAAVRLCRKVSNELDYKIDSTHYWTDSMSVIRYLSNECTRFQTFVANRIAVIRDGSQLNQWHFIESKSNPADCASRGISMAKFLQHTEWLNGPAFLLKPEVDWPTTECETSLSTKDPEIRKPVASTVKSNGPPFDVIEDLMHRHSDWLRLRRVVAWVLLAIEKFKHFVSKELNNQQPKTTTVTVEHLTKAEAILIKHEQGQYFLEEVDALKENHTGSCKLNKQSSLRKLDPILVDGIIRVGGRLNKANIPFNARHPIILPKSSYLTLLYLRFIHVCVGHLGKNSMMAAVRQKYWIPGLAGIIKGLVSKCATCRKYQARKLEQKMADLPADRVLSGQPPFTAVGLDYYGPILVKRSRSVVKRYGVIFTCLSTRAVHLEMATSLTTDSCINAIRRFTARRGPVSMIRSDNGTNLVGSQRELREELQRLNQKQINGTSAEKYHLDI